MYVKKIAARHVAQQLSKAGGAVLAGLDGPVARALAVQVCDLCTEEAGRVCMRIWVDVEGLMLTTSSLQWCTSMWISCPSF